MIETADQAAEELAQEIQLTDRWTPLRHHPIQQSLCYHPARFKWVPAGRRSGKTELMKRNAVIRTLLRGVQPRKILIGAPTYTRCKDIFWEDLVALIPPHWLKYKRESTQSMEFGFHWGAVIRLIGMNKPETVEGVPWDDCFFDELANYPRKCFERHIRPALGTPGRLGRAWFCGVPDEVGTNQAEYEKYFRLGLRWPENQEHCSFWWHSRDIMDAAELRNMMETMDEQLVEQELGGKFVRSGGRAIPRFGNHNVSAEMAEYSGFLPVDHTLDFGSKAAGSLIGQSYRNQVWILDEIPLRDGSTDVAASEFIARCEKNGYSFFNGVRVFGDAAGRTPGQQLGKSDYKLLREIYSSRFRVEFLNLITNPEIKDTINTVRSKVCNWKGVVTLFIHPRCKQLIGQLDVAPWPSKLEEYHLLAALRYYLFALFGEPHNNRGITAIGRAEITEEQRISTRFFV